MVRANDVAVRREGNLGRYASERRDDEIYYLMWDYVMIKQPLFQNG